MNVYLKTPVTGHPAGLYEVHASNAGTFTLVDFKGGLFDVPAVSVQEMTQVHREPLVAEVPAPVETPPERLQVDDYVEKEARAFYDDYSAAVGGKAFNGDPLPPASEFFEDPAKQKQANAYRYAAGHFIDRVTDETMGQLGEKEGPDSSSSGSSKVAVIRSDVQWDEPGGSSSGSSSSWNSPE